MSLFFISNVKFSIMYIDATVSRTMFLCHFWCRHVYQLIKRNANQHLKDSSGQVGFETDCNMRFTDIIILLIEVIIIYLQLCCHASQFWRNLTRMCCNVMDCLV